MAIDARYQLDTSIIRGSVMAVTPVVYVVVHPVDTDAHPTIPDGWRWAVMVGDGPHHDMDRCANAGWAPTLDQAFSEGDQNGASATRALQIAGAPYGYRQPPMILNYDPIPVGRDRLNTV